MLQYHKIDHKITAPQEQESSQHGEFNRHPGSDGMPPCHLPCVSSDIKCRVLLNVLRVPRIPIR